jgi:hypothetical protein
VNYPNHIAAEIAKSWRSRTSGIVKKAARQFDWHG